MFSGIVETTAKVISFIPRASARRLTVRLKKGLGRFKIGQSVAVNGACLTVTASRGKSVTFDVIPQTLKVTDLAGLRAGDEVNIERPLRLGASVDGHYVLGHVEARGVIRDIRKGKSGVIFAVSFPRRLARFIVAKGSIAMEGVSLTVARKTGTRFETALIPHTLRETNLRSKKPGDPVNLETDILLKRATRKKRK